MLSPEDMPVHGRIDGEGRLVAADEALAALHARAGGEPGGPLAVPQFAALARLARRLGIPISRMILAADGERDLDLWVRARPDGDTVAVAIAGWTGRAAAAPIAGSEAPREEDFLRAEADWVWETDATLRLVALSSEGVAALSVNGVPPPLGEPLTRLFHIEESGEGALPLLEALAEARGFSAQIVTLRGTERRFRLAAACLSDPLGRPTGFRGGGFALVDPAPGPPDPPAPATGGEPSAFARRLDSALRTPLNRIVASAETIREQEEGPVRADYGGYAVDIASAGRHLLGLIDDLVDLEAVERDDLPVERETLDLADVARRAAGLLSVRADDRRIRIERPDERARLPATGDFRRVLQILVNLVSNAVRFAPEGSTVRVGAARRGDGAAVIVADEGRGIAPADRERVFAKFERLGASEPGSGLGLYIARRLARAMGGELAIEEQEGPGARFVLTLPAAD